MFDAIAAGGELDASLRLLWTAGARGRRRADRARARLDACRPGSTSCARAGLVSPSCSGRPARCAGAKSTSYAENIAAQGDAAERGADDALLVAPDGTVLEAPTSNVWFREESRLLTPSLALPLLAGVTRAAVQRLAPAAGYDVEEGTFPLDRLLAADEVFLTSSVREVAPVVSIDGAPVGGGAPGPGRGRAAARAAGCRGLP